MKRSLNFPIREVISHINGVIIGIIRIATSKEKLRKHLQTSLYANAYYLIAGSVAAAFLGVIFWMIVARFYLPSEVGLACALISVIGMLTSFSTLGLHIGLIRFLPEERDKQGMINSCLTIPGICVVALAVVFISGLAFWTPKLLFLRENFFYLLCFIIFTVASTLFLVQKNVFVALRTAKFNLVLRIVWNGLKIAFPIALVSLGAFGIFSSWGIALCATVIISALLIHKVQPRYYPLPMIKKHMINDMMHFSFGNYIADFLNTAPNYILPLMVLGILGAEANAYFYIAFTISMMVFMIPVAVAMSLFAEGSNEPEKLRINTIKSIKFTFILLLPLLAIILLFGDKILLLFGKAYSENAFTLLSILALSSIPLAVTEVYIAIKRVQKDVKPIIYLFAFTTIIILGASYLLTPRIGLIGAGTGWLLGWGIAAGVIALIMVKQFRRRVKINN
jgi:O-antigen/teichoic acid export membrane protein